MTFRHYNLPHDKLKSKLSPIVDFDFKGGDKTFIRSSNSGAAYWGNKITGGLGFNKTSLKTVLNHLIENCYFNSGSMTIKQAIAIPMGIDTILFWPNLFLYFYEEEYRSSLIFFDKIKASYFH